jgi:PAS domain S-box-containing protein
MVGRGHWEGKESFRRRSLLRSFHARPFRTIPDFAGTRKAAKNLLPSPCHALSSALSMMPAQTPLAPGENPGASEAPPTENEQNLRLILEGVKDYAIFTIDAGGKVTTWNSGAERIFGYAAAEIIGRECTILWTPEDRKHDSPTHELEIACAKGTATTERWRLRRDGSRFLAGGTINPLYDAHGALTGFTKIYRDITAQQQAEAQLADARARLDAALTAGEIGTWVWDVRADQVHADRNLIAMFGLPQNGGEPLPLAPFVEAVHPGDRDRIMGALAEAMRSQKDYSAEYRLVTPDGEKWVIARGRVERDAQGEVVRLPGVVLDITERRLAEQAREKLADELARQTRQFNAVLSSISDPVYIFDRRGHVHFANKTLLDLWDVTLDGAIGKGFAELQYPPELAARLLRDIEEVFQTGRKVTGEVDYDSPSGVAGCFEHVFSPVFAPDGSVTLVAGSSRDVTARKTAEVALRTAQERMSLAVEASELGTFYCPMPMDKIVWNDKCNEYFWLPPGAEVNFDLFYSILHPDDRERVRRAVERAISEKTLYDAEYRAVAPDGRTRWLRAIGRGFYDDNGQPARFDGVVMDITERKLAAEAMQAQETRLRALTRKLQFLDELAEATRPLVNPEQVMEVVCRRMGQHLGVSRCAYADVDEDSDRFHIQHDYTEGCASTVGHYRLSLFGARAAAEHREGRTLVIHDVDREVPPGEGADMFNAIGIKAAISCPLVKNGRLVDMMGIHQTTPRVWSADEVELVEAVVERSWAHIERARADRAVVESEARFRSLVTATTMIIWRANREGDIVGEAPGWEAFTGQSAAQYQQWGWLEVVHPLDRHPAAEEWRRALAASHRIEIVFRLRRRDGEYRRVYSTGVPLLDARGEVREWVGSCTEVEEKLRLDEEREALLERERAARTEAERASRMKDEFLATLSHELRTPLNAILGWSQVLGGGPVDPDDLAQGLETIERNARAQTQIIEDLLDMSRIISGKVRLDVQRIDLAPVIEAALDTVRPAAAARGIRLLATLDPLARGVSGDPGRLQQVFWNLFSNAIKFTPRGGRVQILLERVNSHLEVSVIDTGEGIRPEFLPHVFDRFRQEDASTARRHGGLGLGLAIVKQLVELHGGSVRAKSAGPGQGATFVVSLPLMAVYSRSDASEVERRHPQAGGHAAMVSPPRIDLRLDGLKVLAVDDEADARSLVKRLLEDCGATVRTAGSASEALEAVRAERPDVLVSDIGMPGEDGYSLIRRVRALEAERGGLDPIPAVALTAYARSEDRMKAVLAGFQMHVSKPVEAAELLTMVASLAGRAGSG